jgi:hypothetical protein
MGFLMTSFKIASHHETWGHDANRIFALASYILPPNEHLTNSNQNHQSGHSEIVLDILYYLCSLKTGRYHQSKPSYKR